MSPPKHYLCSIPPKYTYCKKYAGNYDLARDDDPFWNHVKEDATLWFNDASWCIYKNKYSNSTYDICSPCTSKETMPHKVKGDWWYRLEANGGLEKGDGYGDPIEKNVASLAYGLYRLGYDFGIPGFAFRWNEAIVVHPLWDTINHHIKSLLDNGKIKKFANGHHYFLSSFDIQYQSRSSRDLDIKLPFRKMN